MVRPRRWTSRPGPARAGDLHARVLTPTDLAQLAPCGPACGLVALDHDELLAAVGEGSAAAYVATPHAPRGEPAGELDPAAPLVVLAAPSFAARCSWIPGEAGPDAWVVLGLRTGPEPDAAVGRMLLRAAVAGVRGSARGRVHALEAWAGTADPCEGAVPWWRELGFEVVRPHPIRPRVRTELRGWASWREAPLPRRTAYVRGAVAPEGYDAGRVQRSRRSRASRS